MVTDETLGRMFDAGADTPFSVNEHGLWCDWCGELIAPPWFFEDEDYRPPEACKCGFP